MSILGNVTVLTAEAILNSNFNFAMRCQPVFRLELAYVPHLDNFRYQAMVSFETFVELDKDELDNYDITIKKMEELAEKIRQVINEPVPEKNYELLIKNNS